mgnify:CR=1 FL=1
MIFIDFWKIVNFTFTILNPIFREFSVRAGGMILRTLNTRFLHWKIYCTIGALLFFSCSQRSITYTVKNGHFCRKWWITSIRYFSHFFQTIFKKRKFFEKFIKCEYTPLRYFPLSRSLDQSSGCQHVTLPYDFAALCIKKTPKFITRAEIFSTFSPHAEIFFSKKMTLFLKRKKLQKYHLMYVFDFFKNKNEKKML